MRSWGWVICEVSRSPNICSSRQKIHHNIPESCLNHECMELEFCVKSHLDLENSAQEECFKIYILFSLMYFKFTTMPH